MSWKPPSSLEERIKRALVPPRMELARIVRRELTKGEKELTLLPALVDPARLALDIGANRGIWTHLMVRQGARVIAFEPNPKMFAILKAAMPRGTNAFDLALSDREGEAELKIPRYARGYSNQHASLEASRVGGNLFGAVTVKTARLDDLDPDPVGFIKIDVEGHELAVLRGARETIARDRPNMIIEMEQRHTGRDIGDDLDAVEAMGYETFFIGRQGLQRRTAFDPVRHHQPDTHPSDYVFNFVFLPI